jgi:isoleucyl-tRNA synthetase
MVKMITVLVKYHLDVLCPVDDKGFMTEEAGQFVVFIMRLQMKKLLKHLKKMVCT